MGFNMILVGFRLFLMFYDFLVILHGGSVSYGVLPSGKWLQRRGPAVGWPATS